jgi:hypothetical protein
MQEMLGSRTPPPPREILGVATPPVALPAAARDGDFANEVTCFNGARNHYAYEQRSLSLEDAARASPLRELPSRGASALSAGSRAHSTSVLYIASGRPGSAMSGPPSAPTGALHRTVVSVRSPCDLADVMLLTSDHAGHAQPAEAAAGVVDRENK